MPMETTSSSTQSKHYQNVNTLSTNHAFKSNGVSAEVYSHEKLKSWKLMPSSDPKKRIFRVEGVCVECPKHNVNKVEDNRMTSLTSSLYGAKKKIGNGVLELSVPNFVIDENYCEIPPKREFSITGLNDNIDENFLRSLCKKGEEPFEVVVYYDPRTNKHLGMAFMDFETKKKSDAFIAKYNGKTLMGSIVSCFYDPMAYKISRIYEEITNTAASLPKRYWGLRSSKVICAMRKLLEQRYTLCEGQTSQCEEFADYKSVEIEENSPFEACLNESAPKFNAEDNATSKSAIESNFQKDEGTFGNKGFSSLHNANGKSNNIDNISPRPLFTPMPSSLPRSKKREIYSSEASTSAVFNDASPLPASFAYNNGHGQSYKHANDNDDVHNFRNSNDHRSFLQHSALGNNFGISGQLPNLNSGSNASLGRKRLSNERNHAYSGTKSPMEMEILSPSIALRRESSVLKTSKKQKKDLKQAHRWSSSSESGSSDDEKNSARAKKSFSKQNSFSQQRNLPMQSPALFTPGSFYSSCQPNFINGQAAATSVPFQSPSFNTFNGYRASSFTPADTCSVSEESPLTAGNFRSNGSNFSTTEVTGSRLLPPGLVEPPLLGANSMNRSSITGSTQTSVQNSRSAILTPTKARNLEQRLVRIFGKVSNSGSPQLDQSPKLLSTSQQGVTPTTNTSTSSCSSMVAMAAAATAYYHQQTSSIVLQPLPSQSQQQQNQRYSTPHFTTYVHPAERKKTTAEIEAEAQARVDAEIKRERQERFLRCYDVSRKARSTIEMDLYITIKKDLTRRLESEAFKYLDAELEERKKRESKIPKPTTQTQSQKTQPVKDSSHLLSLFTQFENSLDDSNADSIFGIPYNVRMSAMPSFKKKKPIEVKKRPPSPISKTKVLHNKIATKHAENNLNFKKLKKHKIRARTSSVESEISANKERKSTKKALHKSLLKFKAKSPFSRSRSSSLLSCAAPDETLLKGQKDRDKVKKNKHVEEVDNSSTASQHASSSEAEDNGNERFDTSKKPYDDENGEIDGREKRLRNTAVGCNEEEDEQSAMKSLSEKRAILKSLLRDSTKVKDLNLDAGAKSIAVDRIVAKDSSKLVTNRVVETNIKTDQTDLKSLVDIGVQEISSIIKAPLTKRPRFERQLDTLLNEAASTVQPCLPKLAAELEEARIWPKRSKEEENAILNSLETHGINEEDCAFLKMAFMNIWDQFDCLIPNGQKIAWVQPAIHRIPQELPSKVSRENCDFYYDDPELDGVVPHKSGCARTEGYYKVSRQRKRFMRRFDEEVARTIISPQNEAAVRHKAQASKDERAMNRRLMTWMGDSNFVRVNQLKYRSKMIKFARSRIHGWGLYALETIQPEEMIIEYVGEKVRPTVADEREKSYERRGMGSSYMFRIDGDAVIDATKKGNYGRFINHSCQPNCTAKVVTVDGDKRIVIYSKRIIERGEEITYDYKFAREDEASKIECLCGAKTCHKYLN